jgi:hypothetical protein
MNDVLPVLFVCIAGALLVATCSLGLDPRERKWISLSFVMHVAFACAQVPLTLSFYGGGDMFNYFMYGEILARMMDLDPIHAIPEVTALLLHQPHRLPIFIVGDGSSTGSMSALAAWAFYLLGPSKYAASTAFAVLSLTGKIAMYRVFRAHFDSSLRFYAAVATLFIPSVVFWSSGVIKEAVALAGLGWCLFGLDQWIRCGRIGRGFAIIAAGAVPILLIKPYIAFPFMLAAGCWYYWARSLRRGRLRIRPAHLIVGAVVGLGTIVVLGHFFPDYAVDQFADRTAQLQHVGQRIRGGSTYELASDLPTSLMGQLAYAPAALLFALFRPTLFEVRNLLILANSLETTLLTLLFLSLIMRRNLGDVRREISEDPFLVFCVVFVIAFGTAVGLASTNVGTLSRYRAPILPFFAALLLVLVKPAGLPWRAGRPAQRGHD